MTIRSKILEALQKSGVLCDDCLAEVTAIAPRQSVNICCRDMHAEKVLSRPRETCPRCNRTKIINRLSNAQAVKSNGLPSVKVAGIEPNTPSSDHPWYWEGNVQDKIVQFLKLQGYTVHSASDTAIRHWKTGSAEQPPATLRWMRCAQPARLRRDVGRLSNGNATERSSMHRRLRDTPCDAHRLFGVTKIPKAHASTVRVCLFP